MELMGRDTLMIEDEPLETPKDAAPPDPSALLVFLATNSGLGFVPMSRVMSVIPRGRNFILTHGDDRFTPETIEILIYASATVIRPGMAESLKLTLRHLQERQRSERH